MPSGSGKKRVYRKNTVKGSRKGSKWPEQVKTAALCDLLVNNNICAVARRYGVPESTLRSWMRTVQKMEPDARRALFAAAREDAIRALQHDAAASARASIAYIRRRLEANDRDSTIYAGAIAMLDAADGIGIEPQEYADCAQLTTQAGQPLTSEERANLKSAMERHRPMSDFAAANYLRALTGTAGKAAELLGEDTGDHSIEVVMSMESEDLLG